jgi:hypothetical protein
MGSKYMSMVKELYKSYATLTNFQRCVGKVCNLDYLFRVKTSH